MIFENGKLKAGTYKIQNLHSESYVDIHERSREMCCRPVHELQEGRGIWEIKPLGDGYTIQRVELGKPGQFCAPMAGLQNECVLSVVAYPVAWRVEVVNDEIHRGFEYVRIYWGTTKITWDIELDKGKNVSKIQLWKDTDKPYTWWIWKLIPVETGGTYTPSGPSGSDSLPSYRGDATGQHCTYAQHTVRAEHDDLVTIVTSVTTITTRKRDRAEDA